LEITAGRDCSGAGKRLVVFLRYLILLCLLSATNLWGQEDRQIRLTGEDGNVLGFTIMDAETVEEAFSEDLHSKPLYYLLFLPGPAGFAFLFVMKKKSGRRIIALILILTGSLALLGQKRPLPMRQVRSGIEALVAGRYAGALESFRDAEAKGGENYALSYNSALCHFGLHEWAQAIHCIRKAIRLEPQNLLLRDTLTRMEENLGLTSQVPPGIRLHPSLLFTLLLLLFNASSVAFGIFYWFKRGTLLILSVLLLLTVLGSLGTLLYSLVEAAKPFAVVAGGQANMKRIPLDEAQVWIQLKEGTSLLVEGSAQGFLLVKTGLGLEGWIRADSLLLD
jgi:tetratricopeptide (TPR) repeat protein